MRKAAAKEQKTDKFISKYLTPGDIGRGFGLYRMVSESAGTDHKRIAGTILQMNYKDYLHTRYWQLVSLQVKHDAGYQCQCCGRNNHLVVHHPYYRSVLGYDMYHIDKLECLCRDCHERIHGIKATT